MKWHPTTALQSTASFMFSMPMLLSVADWSEYLSKKNPHKYAKPPQQPQNPKKIQNMQICKNKGKCLLQENMNRKCKEKQ